MTDPPLQVWTRYIAIDIHKHYRMIGGIDAHQRIVMPPRRGELHRWLDWAEANLHPTDAVVIAATTNAWRIYDQIVTLVGRVVVAHPAKVKLIADARVKTDKVDVLTLAQLRRADRSRRYGCHRSMGAPYARCSRPAGGWLLSRPPRKIGSSVCCTV